MNIGGGSRLLLVGAATSIIFVVTKVFFMTNMCS